VNAALGCNQTQLPVAVVTFTAWHFTQVSTPAQGLPPLQKDVVTLL
jgi:hypothetical protein